MNKTMKYILGVLGVLVVIVIAWFSYSYMNAKPVPGRQDGVKSAQEYIQKRKEYYQNKGE